MNCPVQLGKVLGTPDPYSLFTFQNQFRINQLQWIFQRLTKLHHHSKIIPFAFFEKFACAYLFKITRRTSCRCCKIVHLQELLGEPADRTVGVLLNRNLLRGFKNRSVILGYLRKPSKYFRVTSYVFRPFFGLRGNLSFTIIHVYYKIFPL